MNKQTKLEQAIEILTANNQQEIIKIINKLDEEKKKKLVNQVLELDFEELNKLYSKVNESIIKKDQKIEHVKHTDKDKMTDEQKVKYSNIGERIIKNGEYAVVTMAGGQGTRLGHKGPKGTFKLEVEPEPKYLFQILAENLEDANRKYGITLNWYIMTSTENREATENCFKEHNYFGYNKDHIKFFNQGNLPLMFTNGKLVLDKDYSFLLISSYTTGISHISLENILKLKFPNQKIETGENCLPITENNLILPCGIYGKITKN